MGDVQNLQNREAIEKLQELAGDETCLFCTFTGEYSIDAIPMSTMKVDDEGRIWFFSGRSSHKNQHIQQQHKVHLLYGNPGKSNYLSVDGVAEISTDRDKIEELWSPLIKTWFQGGKDDPELTVIKVTPSDAYYWDTKNGKMVSFLKILASPIIGKTMDDGIEGSLNV
jgi:general stress protein 26